jgi:leucyl aminopeptidase (aminopeptidase T)
MIDMKMVDAMIGARNCAITLADVKRGENVLVLGDSNSDARIAHVLAAACREVRANVNMMFMEARSVPHEEPEKMVAAAMKASDVFFEVCEPMILYAHACREAKEAGARHICCAMENINAMCSEGARFPLEITFEVCRRVFYQWRNGKEIHITSESGTDIRAQLKPEYVIGGPMKPVEPGTFEVFAGGTGDVGMWPAWTAEGVMVFDCLHTFAGHLEHRPKIYVEKGTIVKVEGDPVHVKFFHDMKDQFGPDAWHLGELMIGLCPKARVTTEDPTHLEAHRHAGCLHAAMGMGVDFYRDPTDRTTMKPPTVDPGIHLDHLVIEPDINIDGVPCVRKGHLLVLDDPDIRALAESLGVKL